MIILGYKTVMILKMRQTTGDNISTGIIYYWSLLPFAFHGLNPSSGTQRADYLALNQGTTLNVW